MFVLWALNHARVVLNKDVEKANRYFESFGLTALHPNETDWRLRGAFVKLE